jgi:sucrose phosphorylase
MNAQSGVMFNAYPDSIGSDLADIVRLLKKSDLQDAFSLFYILPTFFNSDLDRGFSIVDYNMNENLVKAEDVNNLKDMGIELKFDIVLNHLSVASPQFLDLLQNGDQSIYKDFFIDWNEFWEGHGLLNEEHVVVPNTVHLDKLFMRKSGLPILKVLFPDGSIRPYWNTFYQKTYYRHISSESIEKIANLGKEDSQYLANLINEAIQHGQDLKSIDFKDFYLVKDTIISWVELNRAYLGQMDVNAKSPLVWQYYEHVLQKLASYGCKIVRLDAFAYLHKEIGQTNFFNKPGTWDYLARIRDMAAKFGLVVLPEIHAEYGLHLHDEVAQQGYTIYDFFMPGLILHTIEKKNGKALLTWAKEIISKEYKTVNMLGCHDGIPVLDLKGKEVHGIYKEGLLTDAEIEDIMDIVLSRGGQVKNLYGADGKKISYYQINATYFSALGEDEKKLLLARALQLFMPGIPQIWYLDLFGGKNDYDAVKRAGADGHKEINRTNLSMTEVEERLQTKIVQDQLKMIKFRNRCSAFLGSVVFVQDHEDAFSIHWSNGEEKAILHVDLIKIRFDMLEIKKQTEKSICST